MNGKCEVVIPARLVCRSLNDSPSRERFAVLPRPVCGGSGLTGPGWDGRPFSPWAESLPSCTCTLNFFFSKKERKTCALNFFLSFSGDAEVSQVSPVKKEKKRRKSLKSQTKRGMAWLSCAHQLFLHHRHRINKNRPRAHCLLHTCIGIG